MQSRIALMTKKQSEASPHLIPPLPEAQLHIMWSLLSGLQCNNRRAAYVPHAGGEFKDGVKKSLRIGIQIHIKEKQ